MVSKMARLQATLEHLFSPLALGDTILPNRIVSTAHQTTLVHEHLPTADFVAYHEARARGGAGLIVLEATAVHPSGLLTAHTLGGYLPAIVDGYKRIADAVQPHGTRLFVQLFHGGREQIGSPPRAPALAPSAVPSQRFRVEPRTLTATEIHEIIEGYGRAAELAVAGGLDGVEISAAHRYLIEQFLDPTLNLRDDEWRDGTRFLAAVVRAVREAAPSLCVGVRLSADSQRAHGAAGLLAAEGVDYVSLALGDSSTYLGSVGIAPPPPIPEDAIVEPALRFAGVVPRIATSRIVDPLSAERLVAAGRAEAVGMTRALIADPALPAKARSGRLDELVRCIGCNACIAHYHAETPIACAANAATGRELHLTPTSRAPVRRKFVVVGGGPAGLAAAVEAGRAGHEVILLEKTGRLGGQIALAGAAPGGASLAAAFLDNAERHLAQAGVEVRLDTPASVELVLGLEPAAVIVATGARPYRSDPASSWDVLAGRLPDGATALVVDWGGDQSGLDAAEVLAAAGKVVTLAVASVAAAEGVHQYRRNLYLQRLYRAGVTILQHVELVPVAGTDVTLRNVFAPELVQTIQADAVVLALGRVPEESPAAELRQYGIAVEEAGDCRSPRSLEEAVLEGTLAARSLVVSARP
jgi:2,4-dienoyl-CoA reductase-like NADH-dependent reductase (Old Yellow Enzyme family)/thioredoxin reductase